MRTGQEVYKKVLDTSVRGIVKEVSGDEMTVVWQMSGKNVEAKEKVSDIGKEIFEAEFQLIRVYGSSLRHLAPAKVEEVEESNDYYCMPIKVGDYVIAMAGLPLRFKVEGTISKMYKLSSKGAEGIIFVHVSKDGRCICMDADVRCFTMPERFSKPCAVAN